MTSTTNLTSPHLSLSPSSPLSNPFATATKPYSHPRRRRRPMLKVSYFSQVPSLRLSSRHSNVREWTLKCSGSGWAESEEVEVGASGVAGGEEKVKKEESQRVFEKLLTAEKERVEKQEEFERQANVQLERQLVVASEWSRALLQWQGKLKGTEWDPEDSHRIDYIDFVKLLDSKNVKFMEYSDYGQATSVILPYYKEKTKGIEAKEDSAREIIYNCHVVDRMPVDGWNETWKKLHQQVVNVDMLNANPVPREVYSTMAVTVVWSLRLALAIVVFLCIDHFTRPIYTKVIRFKKEKVKPLREKEIEPIELKTDPRLGSMGKSRIRAHMFTMKYTCMVSFALEQ
ncbi:putative inactive ATP-dependent zinc metalloprotease FTSHI 4, chloroplastic [Drosera capensis]